METEAIFGVVLISFLSMVCAYIVTDVFIIPAARYIKARLFSKKEKGKPISLEEVQAFLEQIDLENLIKEYQEGNHKDEKISTDGDFIEFLLPCKGYECDLSPQREDACRPEYRVEKPNGEVYCRLGLNLTKLVESGETELSPAPIRDPNLLTKEEANLLAEAMQILLKKSGGLNV